MATNAVIVGNRKLKLYFKKIKKDLLHKKLLEEIGHFVDIRIEERTLRGKDADGKMIDGYSKAYELIRQEKGLQTAHKDLFFTGSMYAALTHKTGKDKVTSFFMPTEDKTGTSNPGKALYHDENYNFFALSSEDVLNIFKIIDDHVDEVL